MVVSEGAISNIMGGMENTAGVRLHSHRHKLKQRFDIIRKLGQGTYGKVQLAVNKDTGQEVAIKTIKKAKIETEQDLVRIRREIQIMSSVQHPQIIHIFEVFENREKMVLVMEYAAGGELYDYLSERKVLSVEEARRVFRQVASAVYYCHKHKICHRDLKLENILLDIEGNAKIADFGLSNVFDEKRRLDTFCGSPLYASPEIVKGVPYVGPEVDCWSLGVLLYTLVYGAMPFDGSNFKRLVKQITQGDFYEPPSPSSASPLIRSMLTVAADKRANIADICSHWWVNDGEAKSCLEEAEALANQTPVRLDLLLSLAPKHISSEHMVIQPDEEDTSQRSDDGQSASPNIQLPPPPPVPPPPNGSQARSLSMGAIDSARDADLVQPATTPSRRDEEKRRLDSEAPVANAKKIKESTSTEKPPVEGEKKKVKKTSVSKDGDKEKPERKKSSKKKDSSAEATPMEVDQQTPKPKKKSVKKMDSVEEKSISDDPEKPEKKKVLKKRETASMTKDGEKKRSVKKKEPSVPKSNEPSRESTPKAPSPQFDLVNEVHKAKRTPSEKQSQKSDDRASSIRSPSNKSVISAISTDGTLKASDSSIATRHSVSPAKSIIEVDIPNVPVLPEAKPPISSTSSETKSSTSFKPRVEDKVSKTGSAAKVFKNSSSAKMSKNSSASKLSTPVTNGSDHDLIAPSTDEVLKETASKIKQDTPKTDKEVAESIRKRKTSADNVPTTESISSKESSQHSSVVSTPARSRTGSESSSDTKSGRQDSSRRGSKVFSKAAMWDNMCQQQGDKVPATVDKGRKAPRPGGLNMNDLTKKFEEKAPAERKKPVVGSVKISDVKRSFENKSSDKVVGFRRTSTDGSNDSITSRKDGSLPVSPTRLSKKDDSLPPAGKSVRKTSDVTTSKEKEILIQKESSPDVKTPSVAKDKTTTKTPEVKKASSPIKDTSKKDKSPEKEPSSRVGVKRDTATPKRGSPVKDKPKAVSIAIKKVASTHNKPGSEKPEKEKPKSATSKSEAPEKKASRFESSDSSDSESEAERLLRQLSERRERIEAAKNEKLRKVSQQQEEAKERISRPCMNKDKADEKSRGTLPPLETPSDTPDDMIPVKPAAIPQASMKDAEQPSGAKFATLPRGFKSKASEKAKASLPEYDPHRRKKSEVEILLNNSTQNVPHRGALGDEGKRASYAEIQLAAPQQEYKTEVRHSVAPSSSRLVPMSAQQTASPASTPPADSSLQRAPRERIIPIMMEDNDEEDDDRSSASNYTDARTASNVSLPRGLAMADSPFLHSPLFKGRGPLGGVFGPTGGGLPSRTGSVANSSMGSMDQQRNLNASSSHEPIRMGRRLTIERPDSLSSNDEEEEEEDEEDGFHNLTAESLFSTLLNRVRNLTKNRRMTPLHHQMGFHHSTSPFASGIHSIHSPLRTSQESFPPDHGGFWSSLYSPPRELSRQCSEASTDSRGGERGANKGSTSSWGDQRTLSREMSQESAGANQASGGSDQSTPYNTLPRASSGDEQSHRAPSTENEDLSLPAFGSRAFLHRRPLLLHDRFFGDM